MAGKHGTRNAANKGAQVRKDLRLALYLRDRFTCCYCGTDLHSAEPFNVTLDHLLPRANGGGNEPSNLVTACRACNCSRQDKPWIEYATGGARDRIEQRRTTPIESYRTLAKALIAGTAGDAEVEGLR